MDYILADFNLAVGSKSAKFNSPPIFPAIRYVIFTVYRVIFVWWQFSDGWRISKNLPCRNYLGCIKFLWTLPVPTISLDKFFWCKCKQLTKITQYTVYCMSGIQVSHAMIHSHCLSVSLPPPRFLPLYSSVSSFLFVSLPLFRVKTRWLSVSRVVMDVWWPVL